MKKKYDKVFSVFQYRININMMKNIKFFTYMIKNNMIEKYDIKYDIVFIRISKYDREKYDKQFIGTEI